MIYRPPPSVKLDLRLIALHLVKFNNLMLK